MTGQFWNQYVEAAADQTMETPVAVYYDYAPVNGTRYDALPNALRIGSMLLSYEYDANGNITEIGESDLTTGAVSKTYVYDELNQLIRENDEAQGKTFAYAYDQGGNLLSVKEYAYTTGALPETPVKTVTGTYDAAWKDNLLTWDGTAMTYDVIGNMLTKGSTTFSWQGRKLMSVENGKSIQYSYDHTGARTKKVVDDVVTEYRMAGDLLVSEKTDSQTYWYRYDSSGNLVSATIGGLIYFYVKNLQGDIIALAANTGSIVVKYTYDSWGKLLSIDGTLADTIGVQNPFRYRGYYYDNETGMYYLKSRFYDPELRRFISADSGVSAIGGELLGYNMFAYCFNNPTNMGDLSGNWPKLSTIFKRIATVAIAVAVVAACVVAAPAVVGIGVASGVAAAAASIAATAMCVAGVSATAALVTKSVENASTKKTYRNQSVYVMRNSITKDVQYVGRTNNPERRAREHDRDPQKAHLDPLEVKFTGLTRLEARAMEQILISSYTMQNLDNARREIAAGNVKGFEGKMNNIISIFSGAVESEFLDLMGR